MANQGTLGPPKAITYDEAKETLLHHVERMHPAHQGAVASFVKAADAMRNTTTPPPAPTEETREISRLVATLGDVKLTIEFKEATEDP